MKYQYEIRQVDAWKDCDGWIWNSSYHIADFETAAEIPAEEIAGRLAISKKSMEGVRATVDRHAQSVPASYRFPMLSTHFAVEYRRGTWRLVAVYRSRVSAPSRRVSLVIPETARAALVSRFSAWE